MGVPILPTPTPNRHNTSNNMEPRLKAAIDRANRLLDERPMTAHERLMKTIAEVNTMLGRDRKAEMEIVKCNTNAKKSNFDLRALNGHLLNIKK